ncbi:MULTISPECIES: VanZ family protein [Streptomyces violaceusniger group]|uniref:VanZ family protein n=1 Tax=Streptomyces violaceusniger group TaxID=2839105 RepID=UPI0027DEB5DA|nr:MULTISPECIES: VanZ family protein [Streptomyces violaceusniger group]
MISIAGWEIRRTAEKRTTVKRTAEKKPKTGSRTTGDQKKTSGQGRKKAAAAAGQKNGPRTGGGPTKGSVAAKKQSAKSPTAKARTAKAQPTKARPTKTPPTKAPPVKGRVAEPPEPLEPQGAPEKAPLQRTSFGARVARAMVLLVAFVCMVGFAAALAKATLVPQPGSVDLVHTNLHPGRSLRAYVDQPAFQDTVKQIGGNVLLGAPFGVLLPMLVPKARGAVRVVVVTALVMVAVETAQGLIVEGRAFDIDDVILNTSGALLGYVVVGRWLGRALHPRRRHWWHRWTRRGTEAPPAA